MARLSYVDMHGLKNIDLPQYPDDAWTWYSGAPATNADMELYSRVAFTYRCAQLLAGSVQQMPFALVDAQGNDYDTSADWQNKVGFLPSPGATFSQVSLALFIWGRAYLGKDTKGAKVIGLPYYLPTSIEPKLDGTAGLTGWTRSYTGGQKQLPPDGLVYFWEFDPFVEFGPPKSSRFMAALSAASVLREMDKYLAEFISRGGVLPTMLMVKGLPPAAERERLEDYWNKFINGWFKVAGKIFNAEGFEAKTIGEGLQGLKDANFTQSERENICAAAGVPLSMVLSNASNYATALSDRRVFWENTVIPQCDFLAYVLNSQVFSRYGLTLEWRPESVDAFQEDEQQRALSYSAYIQAGMKPSVAAQVVGIELPAGMEYDELDEADTEDETPAQEEQPAQDEDNSVAEPPDIVAQAMSAERQRQRSSMLSVEAIKDLEIWRRKAIKAVATGERFVFTTSAIPGPLCQTIIDNLAQAQTVDDVRRVFGAVMGQPAETRTDEIKAMIEAIRLGVEALKHEQHQP